MLQLNMPPGASLDLSCAAVRGIFCLLPDPNNPTLPHVLKGSDGEVYHLRHASGDEFALKVFYPHRRHARTVERAKQLNSLSALPGLRCAGRYCFQPLLDGGLIRSFPALEYAVLTPWVTGPCWSDLVEAGRVVSVVTSTMIAWAAATVLHELERRGVSHGDISGENVVLDRDIGGIQLLDLEDLSGAGVAESGRLVLGTPGYNLLHDSRGVNQASSDRFAAAVLLAEMVCWSDPVVVAGRSGGRSYFDPEELKIQAPARWSLLCGALQRRSEDLAALFVRTWQAKHRAEGAAISEWLAAISRLLGHADDFVGASTTDASTKSTTAPCDPPVSGTWSGAKTLPPRSVTVVVSSPPLPPLEGLPGVQTGRTARELPRTMVASSNRSDLGVAFDSFDWSPAPAVLGERRVFHWETMDAPALESSRSPVVLWEKEGGRSQRDRGV